MEGGEQLGGVCSQPVPTGSSGLRMVSWNLFLLSLYQSVTGCGPPRGSGGGEGITSHASLDTAAPVGPSLKKGEAVAH